MFYAYVLENPKGRLYIGHTGDMERRLNQHNSPEGKEHLGKYTHRNGPWNLIGYLTEGRLNAQVTLFFVHFALCFKK